MQRIRFGASIICALILVGCGHPEGPTTQITARLFVPQLSASPGEELVLQVEVTNHGRHAFRHAGCGPGVDVEVGAPDGTTRLVLLGQIFACPLLDSSVLEPGETDTSAVRWKVPAARGTYTLHGGVAVNAGLTARSAAQHVEVR